MWCLSRDLELSALWDSPDKKHTRLYGYINRIWKSGSTCLVFTIQESRVGTFGDISHAHIPSEDSTRPLSSLRFFPLYPMIIPIYHHMNNIVWKP